MKKKKKFDNNMDDEGTEKDNMNNKKNNNKNNKNKNNSPKEMNHQERNKRQKIIQNKKLNIVGEEKDDKSLLKLKLFLNQYEKVFIVTGHGSKNMIADIVDLKTKLIEVMKQMDELEVTSSENEKEEKDSRYNLRNSQNKPKQSKEKKNTINKFLNNNKKKKKKKKNSNLILYGGDPYRTDYEDVAAVARLLSYEHGMDILAVQCDDYKDYIIKNQNQPIYDFLSAAFFYETDKNPIDGKICFGGYHLSDQYLPLAERRLVGQTRICFHQDILPKISGYIAFGGGQITLEDLQHCRHSKLPMLIVDVIVKNQDETLKDNEIKTYGIATVTFRREGVTPMCWWMDS